MDQGKLDELKKLIEGKIPEDVEKMTAKDRLTIYLNLMEFYIPKMQRSNFQIDSDQDREIEIKHYADNGDKELSGNME